MARINLSSATQLAHWSLTLWQAYQLHQLKDQGSAGWFTKQKVTTDFMMLLNHLHLVDDPANPDKQQGVRIQHVQQLLGCLSDNQTHQLMRMVVMYQQPTSTFMGVEEAIGVQHVLDDRVVEQLVMAYAKQQQPEYRFTAEDHRLQMLAWLADMPTDQAVLLIGSMVYEMNTSERVLQDISQRFTMGGLLIGGWWHVAPDVRRRIQQLPAAERPAAMERAIEYAKQAHERKFQEIRDTPFWKKPWLLILYSVIAFCFIFPFFL